MANQRADRVTGIFFFLLGVAVLGGSLAMPDFQEQGASVYEAPGLTPALLGFALAVSGLLLAFRRSRTAHEESLPDLRMPESRKRVLLAVVLTLIYALGLLGRVPFIAATAIFVFSFTLSFEHLIDKDRAKLPRRAAIAALLAAAVSVAISFLFQDLFLVQLP
ncbi:tripartite tricarboxylate transporter TctB family protein [Denitrobaculum tricleocarpae]|uniref:Tripartite tricarboxylate transporter TctB family protein n=1 Tax=Denitrobaculum tricleocarpae TaxID=2591009 RepID=A0A545T7S8_9PROT|nr:tripartite tricarboxylate transporter TctB family protein [Denitrobaculum tricleocarpae]TQV73252.1 tripartite tricarboxylate transporter TctB family protein [Denitrobaculum tricleocarpae]